MHMIRRVFPQPVSNHTGSHNSWQCATSRTKTSVSGDWTTRAGGRGDDNDAYKQCNMIRVSASSWDDARSIICEDITVWPSELCKLTQLSSQTKKTVRSCNTPAYSGSCHCSRMIFRSFRLFPEFIKINAWNSRGNFVIGPPIICMRASFTTLTPKSFNYCCLRGNSL